MLNEQQKIRAVLFYLSLFIFFSGLPFILSFALGYKFDQHTFKFTKSGLIILRTQPQGANVYLNNRLLDEKTPLTINELLPGKYNIRLELERHYPWFNDVLVEAGRVSRIDKVILFPLRPNIKHLNKDKFSLCWIDEKKEEFYYVNPDDNGIYKLNLQGEHSERLADFIKISPPPIKWKLPADREKLLYFNQRQIAIVRINPDRTADEGKTGFILNHPGSKIIDVFWHSDSYHLIIITNTAIEVVEANADAAPVNLTDLNKKDTSAYYDVNTDTLYFIDLEKASDGNLYDNLYRLELNNRLLLKELIGVKPDESRQE